MKNAIILSIAFTLSFKSHSQTAQEWTQQKATQKKYLLQQIAALQVYLGYAKNGYSIVTSGVNTIRNIKNNDLSLHRNFFNLLKNVNPSISRYAKIVDIMAYQVKSSSKQKSLFSKSGK